MARDRGRAEPVVDQGMSVVGAGMTFVGDCQTEGGLRVDGTVDGSVRTGRVLEIGPDGVVKGDVRAQEATVAGQVHGTMVVESRLELRSTGKVDGEVFARRMSVAEGAVVNAAMRMGDRATAAAPTGEPSAAARRLEVAPGGPGSPEEPVETSPPDDGKRRNVS